MFLLSIFSGFVLFLGILMVLVFCRMFRCPSDVNCLVPCIDIARNVVFCGEFLL